MYKWALAIKCRTMLQRTDPRKVRNKECPRGCLNLLRRGNKIGIGSGWMEGTGWKREWGGDGEAGEVSLTEIGHLMLKCTLDSPVIARGPRAGLIIRGGEGSSA